VTAGIAPYDQAYFDRFARQARTSLGRALMISRFMLVEQHCIGTLCDVGIGSGAFIDLRNSLGRPTWGWDVNPAGVRWLTERKLLADPRALPFTAISMFDVLEHVQDFTPLLRHCWRWLFVSLPIFRDAEHAQRSKHFRPNEHVWYFTEQGLVWLMLKLGFECVECHDEETRLGREDILSFAFRRI
jgi:hypothetical protein